jgi:hypothetical protein
MAYFARRDILATLASLASTMLPVDVDGADADRRIGVVDRVRRDAATVLLERRGETVEDRLIALDRLPANAREEGAVLRVAVEDDELVDVEYDPAATDRRTAGADQRFDALAQE